MVRGMEKFKEYFKSFGGNYVIIGGTACEIHEENNALVPRATKDIDIILVVEALSDDFVERFWQFVKDGHYGEKSKGVNQLADPHHEYYRFKNPSDTEFPYQVELFSRALHSFRLPVDAHLTPIPTSDELSSLSAILMNDAYYAFTIAHSQDEGGVHIANVESLICLKCKAYVDMMRRKECGEHIDSRAIDKHKKDVFRLLAMLAPANDFDIPKEIRVDMSRFAELIKRDLPNSDFLKAAGLQNVTCERLLNLFENKFLKKG